MSSELWQPNLDNVFVFKEELLKYISKRMIRYGVNSVSDNKEFRYHKIAELLCK